MYRTAVDTELQRKVDILKLINLVKKYPCIFDPQESGYTCSKINNTVWKKIDQEMGVPVPTSKKVWLSLRTTHLAFRAYEQRLANTSGPDCPVPWQWEKEMSFIDEYEDDCTSTLSVYRDHYYETKSMPDEQEDFSQCRLDDDKLIECIKNYPILTEIFNDSIKNKNAAWNAIAEKMGYSVKCCQYWWKKLAKRYRKELWAHKKGISSNWEHFHKMDFAKVYVSFNIGNTTSLKDQSTVIFRYFSKLGKFLEKAPKEKRAELDDQILNLLLEAELNSYSCVPTEDLQENDTTSSILDNVQPTNKYIVKIVPDGETSLENISEEYEINFLPDDLNIDAPLIECQVDEPNQIVEQVDNEEIKEEVVDVEIKEELEDEEIKEELEDEEIKEEAENAEEKEEENVQKQDVESVETKEKTGNVEMQKRKHVETQEKAESMEIQEEDERVEVKEEVEGVEVKEEVESMEVKEEVESMEVKEEVEAVEITEETEGADIIRVLEEEDEEMVGCYVIEVTDE